MCLMVDLWTALWQSALIIGAFAACYAAFYWWRAQGYLATIAQATLADCDARKAAYERMGAS